MEIVNTNRNSTMDAIKALAILLVVFGHSIQYISGTDFWNNRVFQIIYSVHMPLFFMLSGFFFVGQENKTIQEFLTRKCMTLLLPCMAWSTLSGLGSLVMGGDIGSFVLKVVNPIGWPFWFLKGLFGKSMACSESYPTSLCGVGSSDKYGGVSDTLRRCSAGDAADILGRMVVAPKV